MNKCPVEADFTTRILTTIKESEKDLESITKIVQAGTGLVMTAKKLAVEVDGFARAVKDLIEYVWNSNVFTEE